MKPDLPIDTQILWLAAELIETHGHCKGDFSTWDGRLCAIEAISQAMLRLGVDSAPLACERLRRKVNSSIIYWNDHPSRTAEEVALALRTA